MELTDCFGRPNLRWCKQYAMVQLAFPECERPLGTKKCVRGMVADHWKPRGCLDGCEESKPVSHLLGQRILEM